MLSFGAVVFPKYCVFAEDVQLDNKHANSAIAIPICTVVKRDFFIDGLQLKAWASKERRGKTYR